MRWTTGPTAALFLIAPAGFAAQTGRVALPGHVPAMVSQIPPTGVLPGTNELYLAIGLPLRNEEALDALLRELYDPASTNFHKFLTSQDFTARFGPSEQDYHEVMRFAEANGLRVVGTHSNRSVLDVRGSVASVEQAFQITLRTYRHPTESRQFYAPDTEPSVPANLRVGDMWGLTDYGLPRPLARTVDLSKGTALNYNGSGPGGAYKGNDFRNAYAPGSSLNGAGQTAAVAEFDGYYASDISSYEAQCGYPNVPLQNVLVDNVSGNPGYSGVANAVAEVSLDIEMVIAMAPGLSKLLVYEGSSPYDVFARIATDNLAKQISCSWAWSVGPTHTWVRRNSSSTLDSQLKQMTAQGQAFFEASGDSDAYTGSQAMNSSSGPIPVDSIYLTSVGGTSLTMGGTGASWSSETVWNWGNNTGSGGGVSPNYPIPYWQTNVSMASNNGSTVNRNVPDVALTADAVYVIYNNGSTGTFGGTSCAAPLWAGFCSLVNQQSVAVSGTPVGFLNPALYQIAAGPTYTDCFHDITTGNNIGTHTAGLYYAVPGYDLATGLGTPNGANLINALAPPLSPHFSSEPTGQTVTNGANLSLSATVVGQQPLYYQWLFNGAPLAAAGNISGTTSNVLTITSATTNNSGSYTLVATNSYGAATSSVAVVSVGLPPVFSTQPVSQTALAGSTAVFSAAVTGSTPLTYHWRLNGLNLINSSTVSGATTDTLTLSNVTASSSGSYTLSVVNAFGSAISSAAGLTVGLPPTITGSLTSQNIECGSNALFTASVSGTTPLSYQWSLDGVPVAGATGTSLSLVNVHLPNHTVTFVTTNLYGSVSSNVLMAVHDTLGPTITLEGGNPIYVELGTTFADPGATGNDLCAGPVPVVTAGTVNANTVGTNTLTYSATDGNGNTNFVTRAVIVHDTTPPTILWSFTNLVLAAGTNCDAVMPDVTTTNFILAADLSGTLTYSQTPTNNARLQVGTNVVVTVVEDASSNASYSTNTIVVEDQAPPQILAEPQSGTNLAGATVTLSVTAAACTPLAFQWCSNSVALQGATNRSLVLSNVSLASTADYWVVTTAAGGSTTSAVATLTVVLNPTLVALDSTSNPSGYRGDLYLSVTATPASATGTVQFQTNGVTFDTEPLVAGLATSTNVSFLPRGTNVVTVLYPGDANDLPAASSFEQIVTNHPPVAADAYYTRASGGSLNIVIADLTTNWADVDGDTVSLVAVSVSTNGVSLTNDSGTLVYFNTNDVADQFTCTLSDGWGGTNYQTVNIAMEAPVNPTPSIIGASTSPGGGFNLSLAGAPGYSYILEAAIDLSSLSNWLSVATNTLATNGVWQFTDPQATNFPQRFYRLRLGP
jgi:subtilase family serine protease